MQLFFTLTQPCAKFKNDNLKYYLLLKALASAQVPVGGSQNQEAGHYSDTTASAGGSDDEGSTAATDGSTLRTSPADQVITIITNGLSRKIMPILING